jgi:hypothetical protein
MEKEETGKMAEDKGKKGLLTPLKKGSIWNSWDVYITGEGN